MIKNCSWVFSCPDAVDWPRGCVRAELGATGQIIVPGSGDTSPKSIVWRARLSCSTEIESTAHSPPTSKESVRPVWVEVTILPLQKLGREIPQAASWPRLHRVRPARRSRNTHPKDLGLQMENLGLLSQDGCGAHMGCIGCLLLNTSK